MAAGTTARNENRISRAPSQAGRHPSKHATNPPAGFSTRFAFQIGVDLTGNFHHEVHEVTKGNPNASSLRVLRDLGGDSFRIGCICTSAPAVDARRIRRHGSHRCST
jgi:hypothetical protein